MKTALRPRIVLPCNYVRPQRIVASASHPYRRYGLRSNYLRIRSKIFLFLRSLNVIPNLRSLSGCLKVLQRAQRVRFTETGSVTPSLLDPGQNNFEKDDVDVPQKEKLGVMLLNLGGPESLDDVQPFLYNLFADPDIIRLPTSFQFLQKPLASVISATRASKSIEGYKAIGGGSPLRRITEEQGKALKAALAQKGKDAEVYVAMRYWHPYTEEAMNQVTIQMYFVEGLGIDQKRQNHKFGRASFISSIFNLNKRLQSSFIAKASGKRSRSHRIETHGNFP